MNAGLVPQERPELLARPALGLRALPASPAWTVCPDSGGLVVAQEQQGLQDKLALPALGLPVLPAFRDSMDSRVSGVSLVLLAYRAQRDQLGLQAQRAIRVQLGQRVMMALMVSRGGSEPRALPGLPVRKAPPAPLELRAQQEPLVLQGHRVLTVLRAPLVQPVAPVPLGLREPQARPGPRERQELLE